VTADLPLNRDGSWSSTGRDLPARGELEKAADTVEQLEPSNYCAVSLAELYAQMKRFDEVVELTEKVANEDDASALLLVFRGVALREQGFLDAATSPSKQRSSHARATRRSVTTLFSAGDELLAQGKKDGEERPRANPGGGLELRRCEGETGRASRRIESAFAKSVTLRTARQVADIIKHLPDGSYVEPTYAYYM